MVRIACYRGSAQGRGGNAKAWQPHGRRGEASCESTIIGLRVVSSDRRH